MDGKRFDFIVREIAGQRSRRSLLQGGLAAVLGVLSSRIHRGAAAQLECSTGTACGETCVDLQSDANNCGMCGNFCGGVPGPGYASVGECVAGECVAVCLPEADDCAGECTDLNWDTRNCGSCGNQCPADQICCTGNCVSRDSAERFCDFCGFQGGWPQGCNDDEICSGGLCVPVVSDSSGGESTGSDPAEAAYQLSVLESQGEFDALYDQMHADAQIAIPRGAVTHWYAQHFAPLGPQPIDVTGVELAEWTWEVIDRTYAETAVVSFEQAFTHGDAAYEIVRLVKDVDGQWRWFFGRSEQFVEEMTAEAEEAGAIDLKASIPDAAGIPPASLFAEAIAALDSVSPTCLDIDAFFDNAPAVLQGAEKQELTQEPETAVSMFSYLPSDRAAGDAYPDLLVRSKTLGPDETPGSEIAAVEESMTNWSGPEFSLPPRALYIDLAPASLYLVSYYEEYTEVLGHVPVITWAERGGTNVYGISGPAIAAGNELLASWSENLRAADGACAASQA